MSTDYITIQLTKGKETYISPEYEQLSKLKWTTLETKDGCYAMRSLTVDNKRIYLLLHRVIMELSIGRELTSSEYVDHIDMNSLNNTIGNLRICTNSQNNMNKPMYSNNTSGYKGVTYHKLARKWMAQIKVNYEKFYLGLFDTPEKAYQAYCEAAERLHGEFKRLE